MRVLIVDDEQLARDRIRLWLERDQLAEEILEVDSTSEALTVIPRDRPDVVFLDVQMPGMTGLEMLEKLALKPLPAVIFVTAHDRYAVQAFEFHAVDYLLKPVSRERLKLSVQRAAERIAAQQTDDLALKNAAMAADMRSGATLPTRIPIKNSGKIIFINLTDVDWIASADNYSELHVGPKSHLIRETLTHLAERLPKETFCRVSRTAIINTTRLTSLQSQPHGEYAITLTTGVKITLSRSYRDALPRLREGR